MFSRFHAAIVARVEYKWLVVVSITLGIFMSLLDSTIVNVAIPTMKTQFRTELSQVQWVVTIYMITQAAVIPSAPFLTARFGSKRAYVWTLAAFLAGSMLCGCAWNLPSLVFFRFVQGLGGGVLLPMVMTLLYRTFPQEERGRASSAMSIPLIAAPLLGPVLGGYLVSRFGWPTAFFINAPLGVVALWIATTVLEPEEPDPNARLDLVGLALAAFGSSATLFGISGIASNGVLSLQGASLVVGAASLAGFALYELRSERKGRPPLLDLRRFADRTYALSVLAICVQNAAIYGTLFSMPQYLQTLRGLPPYRSGEIQAAQSIATLFVTPIAGKLSDRIGPKPVSLTGFAVFAVALAILGSSLSLSIPLLWVAVCLVPVGLGSALSGQATVCAMSNIDKGERYEVANASTILSCLRATAAPFGVALASGLIVYWSGVGAGKTASPEATMGAMKSTLFVGVGLATCAALALAFVPRMRKASGGEEALVPSE